MDVISSLFEKLIEFLFCFFVFCLEGFFQCDYFLVVSTGEICKSETCQTNKSRTAYGVRIRAGTERLTSLLRGPKRSVCNFNCASGSSTSTLRRVIDNFTPFCSGRET